MKSLEIEVESHKVSLIIVVVVCECQRVVVAAGRGSALPCAVKIIFEYFYRLIARYLEINAVIYDIPALLFGLLVFLDKSGQLGAECSPCFISKPEFFIQRQHYLNLSCSNSGFCIVVSGVVIEPLRGEYFFTDNNRIFGSFKLDYLLDIITFHGIDLFFRKPGFLKCLRG